MTVRNHVDTLRVAHVITSDARMEAVGGLDELRAEFTRPELHRRRGPLLGRVGRRPTVGQAHAHPQGFCIKAPPLL